MTPKQCRAARAWCHLYAEQLAQSAGVTRLTVTRFETGRRIHPDTVKRLQTALEKEGVKFLFTRDGDGVGIEAAP